MSQAFVSYLTFEEFLDGETHSGVRHELVDGRAYAMSGGTERHSLVSGLIYTLLSPGAFARGCRPFQHDRLVRIEANGNAYYPDVMVVCGPAPHVLHETAPKVIVEVLSPSTMSIDRREKATNYALIPSLDLYLVVDPNDRRIDAAYPLDGVVQGWSTFGPGQLVVTDYGDIHVDGLCDALDAITTT